MFIMEIEFLYEVNNAVLHQEFLSGECKAIQRSVKLEFTDLSEQSRKNLLALTNIKFGMEDKAISSIWDDGKPNEHIQVWLREFVLTKEWNGYLSMTHPLIQSDHVVLSLEEIENTLADMVNQWNAKNSEQNCCNEELHRMNIEKPIKAREEQKPWVEEYGSERLRLAYSRGYDCDQIYVEERAAIEFPGFSIGMEENTGWYKAENPSLDALILERALRNQGREAEVTTVIYFPAEGYDDEADEENFERREAMVIKNYLGEYDLIKVM
jgi:hypothetical protein